MRLTTPCICQDWCCMFQRGAKRQGIWERSDEQLISFLETNTRTDPWHAWVRVSIYIELSFRQGTFTRDYPVAVFKAVFGDDVPPPQSNVPSNMWYSPQHDRGRWPKSIQ